MKRFLLFIHEEYEENGGWCDFVDTFDTAAEAIEEAKRVFKLRNISFGGGEIVHLPSGFYLQLRWDEWKPEILRID